jgi:hypothetical protein
VPLDDQEQESPMPEIEQIRQLLRICTKQQRHEIFEYLRKEFAIHPIESELNVQAEVILEAIHRSSDLTQRGVRGVIAEAAFHMNVLSNLDTDVWAISSREGDAPYDFLLADGSGEIRIQLKMQRKKDQRPMMACEGYTRLPKDMFVVETQRTRGGTDPRTKEDTRPYRFREFDILAVSMHPSTNDWTAFMYTVAGWLLPRPENKRLLLKFQPVAAAPNTDWTDSLETCILWLRSGKRRRICTP